MLLFSLIAAIAFAQFVFARSLWPIILISLVYFAVWPPIGSLAESVTVQAARLGLADYGRVRLWGSFSFIAAAALAGEVLTLAPVDAIFWIILALQLIVLLSCFSMPGLRDEPSRSRRLPIVEVLATHGFARFLISCGLIQGSHAVYYGFGALAWKAAGYSEAVIGLLWAQGVLAEIVLFAVGSRLLRRLSASALIAIAGLAASARWLGFGLTHSLPVLILLQLLHAFSFGAAHLAAMEQIAKEVPPSLSATAQSLYAGVVWGLFLGGGLLAAGYLYQAFATDAYQAMAAIALVGAVISPRPGCRGGKRSDRSAG
jgi:PPP family 3-phenylpropionic acid transporter